jgi:hypothetical protein
MAVNAASVASAAVVPVTVATTLIHVGDKCHTFPSAASVSPQSPVLQFNGERERNSKFAKAHGTQSANLTEVHCTAVPT